MASLLHTMSAHVDQDSPILPILQEREDLGILEQEESFFMNGSCMSGRVRSRSPPQRFVVYCRRRSNENDDSRSKAAAVAPLPPGGCVPTCAAFEVSNLPPFIKPRFPSRPADEMERPALLRHCHSVISHIRATNPRPWYIGITASPLFRWNMSHFRDYTWMNLLVASRTSELTHSIESELIEVYIAMHDITLQNIDPRAKGSMQGSPSFCYVVWDVPGPLRRRGRHAG